jgi:hypothetical protein
LSSVPDILFSTCSSLFPKLSIEIFFLNFRY